MTARARSKYADSSSRTASGSRLSDRGVKPTRSANSRETIPRSETGATGAVATGVAAADSSTAAFGAAVSADPHSPQNLPDVAGAPHCGHVAAIDVPHSVQNFTPGPLGAPQP